MSASPFDPFVTEPWMAEGVCLQVGDPDLWFPDRGGNPRPAKRICAQCPVRDLCLEYSYRTGQRHGIYGGLTAHERDQTTTTEEAA